MKPLKIGLLKLILKRLVNTKFSMAYKIAQPPSASPLEGCRNGVPWSNGDGGSPANDQIPVQLRAAPPLTYNIIVILALAVKSVSEVVSC
jgi:hypothetical protein